MPERITEQQRSAIMSKIKTSNTAPEMIVRRMLFSAGYRYRLNVKKLPGKPDIVLNKYHIVIFVNGCLWHGHKNCRRAKRPVNNKEYWDKKIDSNINRDRRVRKELRELGFHVITIWECQLRQPERVKYRLYNKIEQEKRAIQA